MHCIAAHYSPHPFPFLFSFLSRLFFFLPLDFPSLCLPLVFLFSSAFLSSSSYIVSSSLQLTLPSFLILSFLLLCILTFLSFVSLSSSLPSVFILCQASMPLFTVFLSRYMLNQKHSKLAYFSLVPIILGKSSKPDRKVSNADRNARKADRKARKAERGSTCRFDHGQ